MRLYKIGRTYYADIHTGGRRVRRSTRCTDRRAAEAVAARWERVAADPAHAAAETTTLATCIVWMLADRKERGRSDSTVSFYASKAGHLVRIFGGETPVARVDATAVDGYVTKRKSEGASNHTLTKELVTLRVTLKLARRRGVYHLHPEDVLPHGWESGYVPRTRTPTPAEVDKVLAKLPEHRADWLRFVIATGARTGEAERALPGDIDLARGFVFLRGTKTERSAGFVPVLAQTSHYLADLELPLQRWPDGVRPRDLAAACKRAGVDYLTLTDLRRAAGSWLRERIGDSSVVGSYLRHTTSQMAERVYAPLRAERLAKTIARLEGPKKRGRKPDV